MFYKEFDIRWSDLDPNRHLANSAYINLTSATRMAFMIDQGFGHKQMTMYQIGPLVFHEHIHYFKEIFGGQTIYVSMELAGLSADGAFFKFVHNFYDSEGRHMAHAWMLGAWFQLKTRKITALPDPFMALTTTLRRTVDFIVLTKEDTRISGMEACDQDAVLFAKNTNKHR